jgi:uncharacterized protein (DUF427 family)
MLADYMQALGLLRLRARTTERDAGPEGSDERRSLSDVRATWNGTVLAESDQTIEIEGNQYFPPDSVRWEYLVPSENHTTCWWKGRASYYHVKVGDRLNENAAWYYPNPKEAAEEIKDYVAFWKGIRVR